MSNALEYLVHLGNCEAIRHLVLWYAAYVDDASRRGTGPHFRGVLNGHSKTLRDFVSTERRTLRELEAVAEAYKLSPSLLRRWGSTVVFHCRPREERVGDLTTSYDATYWTKATHCQT